MVKSYLLVDPYQVTCLVFERTSNPSLIRDHLQHQQSAYRGLGGVFVLPMS
jgi:hypothetical protein